MRIHRKVKQRNLYEIGYDKKLKFIEYLHKTHEKYKFPNRNIEAIANDVKYNNYNELDMFLKKINKSSRVVNYGILQEH